MTFKNLFKASKIRERVPLISRITQEWEVVFYIWKWNIANTCKHFRMQLLLTHAAVTDYSFCKKEGEKENEWSYSSFSIFFLSKPWSLLKSKFSKVFMMCKAVRDFGWCRKQAFIFKIKREKRNLIKDDQGSFLFIFLECKTPFLAWFHFVIFLPHEVRTFYSIL